MEWIISLLLKGLWSEVQRSMIVNSNIEIGGNFKQNKTPGTVKNKQETRKNRHKNHKRREFFRVMSTLHKGAPVCQLYISVFLGVMDHTSSSRIRPVQKYVLFSKKHQSDNV
jgi:hypothetical protein